MLASIVNRAKLDGAGNGTINQRKQETSISALNAADDRFAPLVFALDYRSIIAQSLCTYREFAYEEKALQFLLIFETMRWERKLTMRA